MALRNRMLFSMILFTLIGIIAGEDYIVWVNDTSTAPNGKCGDIRTPCQDITSALQNISNWAYTDATAWVHIQKLDNCTYVSITDSLLDEKTHNSKVARRSIGFRGGRATGSPTKPICKRQKWELPWIQLEGCTSLFDLHFVDMVVVNGSFLAANCSQTRLNIRNLTVQDGEITILNLMNNATTITNATLEGPTGLAIVNGLVKISGLNATDLDMMELVNISDMSTSSKVQNSTINGRNHYGIYITGEVPGFAFENVKISNIEKFEMLVNIASFEHPREAYSDGLQMVNASIEADYMLIDLTNDGALKLQNVDVTANSGILSLEYRGAKTRAQIRTGGDGMISYITNCKFWSTGASNEFLHINITGEPSSQFDNQLSVHNLSLLHTTMKMDLKGSQAYLGGLQYDLLDEGVDPLYVQAKLGKLMIENSTIKACFLKGEVDILSISGSNYTGDWDLSAWKSNELGVTLTNSLMDVNNILRGNRLEIHKCVFPKTVSVDTKVLDISNSKFLEGGLLSGIRITVSDSTWTASNKGSLVILPPKGVLNGTASLKNITVTNIFVNLTGFNETRISGQLEFLESAYFKPGNLSKLDLVLTNISKDIRFDKVTPIFGMGKISVSHVRHLSFEGKVDLEAVAPVQRRFNLTSLILNNSLLEGSLALSGNGTYKGGKLAGFILQNATNVSLQLWEYGKGPFERKAFRYWGYVIAGLLFVIVFLVGACYCKCCKGERKYSSQEMGTGPGYRYNTATAHTSGTIGPTR